MKREVSLQILSFCDQPISTFEYQEISHSNKCDHIFTNLGCLKINQKISTLERDISALIVTTKLQKKENLAILRESVHDGVINQCDLCDYKSSTQRSVMLHKKSRHVAWSWIVFVVMIRYTAHVLRTYPGPVLCHQKQTSWGGQSWWPMYSKLPTSGLPSMWPILRWASVRVFYI